MINKKEQKILVKIDRAKQKLGKSLLILGHHYQNDQVIRFADIQGDSLALARKASQEKEAVNIIFCGVHFMAESAAILCKPNQRVFLPDLNAGCPLASMANISQVVSAWTQVSSITSGIIPITYVNSSAKIKAFCGERGGIVCTSSNAEVIFDWAMNRGKKIFFFPDEHLGRNTSIKKGIREREIITWNPWEKLGGNTRDEIKKAKIILWKGFCHVHTNFNVEQIEKIRQKYSGINIIAHPECTREVVEISDFNGSTSFIIKKIKDSAPGTEWAIGTEINLVGRLAREYPDRFIIPISRSLCPNMFRINTFNLWAILESILAGKPINRIKVDPETCRYAKLALNRMLDL